MILLIEAPEGAFLLYPVKDYYVILGVHRTASAAEIKRRYRRLAIHYHPDKNPDPSAEQLFKEINEAYDILGDPEKRKVYDARLENPFAEIFQEEKPRHRDPAYKSRYPPGYRAPRKPSHKELIRQYVHYFKWITFFGFALTFLIALDFILPYRIYEDKIQEIYTIRRSRGRYSQSAEYAYDRIITDHDKKFRLYNHQATNFQQHDLIKLETTLLFSEPMRVRNLKNNFKAELGFLYQSGVVFAPLTLFIITSLGILFRNRVEFLFNVSIVSAVLIVIVLYLVFVL